MKSFALAALALVPALALAQDCPKPVARQLPPMQVAVAQDEAMSKGFEVAAAACAMETIECDDARAKCGLQLTQTLQAQITFDEGAYLRDMLIAYQGQQYRMTTPIASAPALTDVSCNADAATLKAAGVRRHQQSERRKLILAEYPKWFAWAQQQQQSCVERMAADRVRADAAAADAAKLAAAAELAKKAEEVKLEQARAAEKAAKERAAAEAKAKEEAAKREQEAQAEAKKQKEQAEAAAAEAAAAEKRARETAEEKAARQQKEAEEARIVADREGKKQAAERHQQDLIDKEKAREADAKLQREQARQAAETAHQKRVEELKRNLELSEADKAAQLAQADKDFEASEAKRREAADKEISAAGQVDRSDERLNGALSAHGAGGYVQLVAPGAAAFGGQVTIRQGFWGTAPASGLASGVELRATGLLLFGIDGVGQLIQVAPEFRYWLGRLGLGATFEWQVLQTSKVTGGVSTLGLGPTLSVAAVDTPDQRLIFSARYTPFLNNNWARVAGEIEGAYGYFSFAAQGGVLADSTGKTLGWFAGASLGARLKW